MQQKAQGLSMNTIVIASIALLVLVVLSVIFIRHMDWFVKGSKDCQSMNGECQARSCAEGYTPTTRGVCYDANNQKAPSFVCCLPLG